MSSSESSFWLTCFTATIPFQTKTNRRASSILNQGGAETWEIHSVEQYEYKTDFNLNERTGFTNCTKHVFVQNKSLLQVQKHKGVNATFLRWCYTRRFATTIFSATQRCNIVATLFRMVTTLFQHCNAVLC